VSAHLLKVMLVVMTALAVLTLANGIGRAESQGCPFGTTWNPVTRTCDCPMGQYWNPGFQQCESTPPGQYPNPWG
jgi:hypothetical protein